MRLFLGSFAKLEHYGILKSHFSFLEAKWVQKHNIHLTYLFLGERPNPYGIIEKLERIEYEKKDIPLHGLGFFGHPPKVLYTKAQDEGIVELHHKIVKRLQIEPNQPFVPHVTLCRIKSSQRFSRFIETLQKLEHHHFGTLHQELHLIESLLTPKGPKYKIIHTF